MNMEKSTRYQAIGFIGSLFFVFNSCYLAYTIMYTYFMSDIQGFMERLFMVLSWLGLGVCLLLFVRGGALPIPPLSRRAEEAARRRGADRPHRDGDRDRHGFRLPLGYAELRAA